MVRTAWGRVPIRVVPLLDFPTIVYPVQLYGTVTKANVVSTDQSRFSFKVDHKRTQKDQLAFVYLFDDVQSIDNNGGAASTIGAGDVIPSRAQNVSVSWTRTLSNTVLNQARVAYQRRVANFTSPDAVNIPSIFTLVDPIGTSLGASSAIPQFFTDNEFQYKDDLSITHGKHNLKSGFEYREFLRGQDAVIREGLLGGVLSCAWPLLNLEDRKPRLSYEGLKTIDGQQLYDLRYRPQRSTDLDIHLYFDPQTFRQ